MSELAQAMGQLARELPRLEPDRARCWLADFGWPEAEVAGMPGLAAQIGEHLTSILEPGADRARLERAARRAGELEMHLRDLSELDQELERYRHERAILPSRESLHRQFDAIETRIDLHREVDLQIHCVQLRAAIQRGRIEALLRGEDPEAATADLVRRDR